MLNKALKGIFLAFSVVVMLCAFVGVFVVGFHFKLNFAAILLSIMGYGAIIGMFWIVVKKEWVNEKVLLAAVIILGAVARLIYVILAKQPVESDFKTYHELAEYLANGVTPYSGYVARFPHVMGIAVFLAPFYKLFGCHELVAQILNVALDTASAVLIYLIFRKLFSDKKGGVFGAFLFSVSPSVIFYCELICTEKLFAFLVLIFIYIVLHIEKKPLIFLPLSGIVAGLTNAVRPCGAMLIIAVTIYIFAKFKGKLSKKILAVAGVIAIYSLVIFANATIVEGINQTEIATDATGWNLYVGANTEFWGQWNEEDGRLYDKLMEETNGPNEFHKEFKDLAFKRIKDNGIIKSIVLMVGKFSIMWATDVLVYSYLHQEPIFMAARYIFPLDALSTGFYPWIVVLLFIGARALLREKEENKALIVLLIILGGAGMHLFAEVMGRYGYASMVLFYIIAAYEMRDLKNEIGRKRV